MENMDKGLTVPKWVLIVWPKIPQNLSAQFVCPSPKVLDFNEKRLHWASVVRDPDLQILGAYLIFKYQYCYHKNENVHTAQKLFTEQVISNDFVWNKGAENWN